MPHAGCAVDGDCRRTSGFAGVFSFETGIDRYVSCVLHSEGKQDKWSRRTRFVSDEESPGFTGQGCRITSGGGDSKESATEMNRRPQAGKGGRAV